MSREMIVGGEHMVGGHARHHDYDELMEMSGEPSPARPMQPQPQAPQMYPGPQQHPHHPHHPQQHHNTHRQPEYFAYGESPQRKRLVSEEPTHERQFPIGFIREGILPGDELDIEVKPQV